jgi:hypothetical protein
MGDEQFTVPERSIGDVGHAVAKAVLGLVPGLGGPAVELFQLVVAPPLERRRQEWMREVGAALRALADRPGLPLDDLQNNDAFLDTIYHASALALRTGQAEKRAALRNAVLNAALPAAPEPSIQQMFLGFIEAFTTWHLRLLALVDDLPAWAVAHGRQLPDLVSGSLAHLVEAAFPELMGQRAFYDQVWRDLVARGLVTTEGLHGLLSGQGLRVRRTTDFGRRFLAFIAEPS